MKKIENFSAIAPKLRSGQIEYCLWTDDDGALYVQILRNLTETEKPGTHSKKLLFRVSDYLSDRNTDKAITEMRGVNHEHNFSEEICNNHDDAGFVKAVLRHLFP